MYAATAVVTRKEPCLRESRPPLKASVSLAVVVPACRISWFCAAVCARVHSLYIAFLLLRREVFCLSCVHTTVPDSTQSHITHA